MRRRFKQMYAEFKEFAFKGNMIDLAVAVVLGAAFSGVVNALVKDIIMPAISYVTTAASEAKNAATHVASTVGLTSTTQPAAGAATQPATEAKPSAPPPAAPPAAPAKSDNKAVDFSWRVGRFEVGNFIGEIINFVLVAFAVFIFVVKFLGSVMKKVHRSKDPDAPTTKECPRCLSTVPYLATKCAHCTIDLEPPPASPPAAVPQG